MRILVAGGAGYIGSHTIVELYAKGHTVVCVDNLYNAKLSAVKNVEKIVGKKIPFYKVDCCDKKKLRAVFKKEKVDAIIMFQGYKAVGESVKIPLKYYRNNIDSALTIIELMDEFNIHNIMFSSSATVYGKNAKSPIDENDEALRLNDITNPYGETKAMIEKILMDKANSDSKFKAVILRYFNPVGAHESALIGEDPNGLPNNLMPYIAKVATGKLPFLNVYGNNYKTKDGTGVRDYIHVVDLAKGHVSALKCYKEKKKNIYIYNLGTGRGTSVLELVNAYEKASGKKVKYKIVGRRAGDVDKLYCKPKKAKTELGWEAKLNIENMCKSSYNYENGGRR
ncbi:MAG: UDP-glucose 4-epimerase GalE [Lachnospiraceae bacterium]|nr:UDP-glucose 4-epimerase GalE [Lachnospiraceae bacterium]